MSVAPTWIFDDSPIPDPLGYGERAVRFVRKLKHPKSTLPGNAFALDPWQERILRRVYGDVHPNGERRVKTVYLRVARGNRKTSLSGAITALHLFGPEKTPGGRAIAAAVDQAQARLTWEEAGGLIEMSPTLSRVIAKREAPVYSLAYPKLGTRFEAVSSDGKAKHGRTFGLLITDEVVQWTGDELWKALTTGLSKVPNALHVVTTTAGAGQEGVGWRLETYARDVAAGIVDDDTFLPIMFEIDENDDWQDESIWHKANPGLRHGYPDLPGLRSRVKQARRDPAARVDFEQFHLNRWQDAALSPWLDMAVYDEGSEPIDEEALLGRACWIGVDYGAVDDLTAIVAAFPNEDGRFILKCWALAPEDGLRRKAEQHQAAYLQWRADGHLIATEGNIVDRREIAEKLREIAGDFDVREIAYDPYKLRETMAELAEEGLPVVEFRQGWVTMGPAIDEIQRAILGGRFVHGGHPILRAHFNNVVTKTDSSGNASFHKGKSRGKIDAAVAATMAVARAAAGDSARSIYEDTEARPDGLVMI